MIIKIACKEDESSWRFYEGDRVQHAHDKMREWRECMGGDYKMIVGPGIHEDMLVTKGAFDEEALDCSVALISFVSRDGTDNNIYTDMPVYLMTETGETVERLN